MKRTVCLILAVLMIMAMVPAASFADTVHYDIWVNGEEFTSDHMEIKCGDGKATLMVSGDKVRKIWLDNATITNNHDNEGIDIGGSDLQVTIILTGENKISIKDNLSDSWGAIGIYSNSPITITTDGVTSASLDMDLGKVSGCGSTGFNVPGRLTIVGIALNFTGHGINVYDLFSGNIDSVELYQTYIHSVNARFSDLKPMLPIVLEPAESDYEIHLGMKSDGSDASLFEGSFLYNYQKNLYSYIDISPKTKHLSEVDFDLVIPNDGMDYPDGEIYAPYAYDCTYGIAPLSVQTSMNGKLKSGKASAGDIVRFGITFETLRGYEVGNDTKYTINGKKADVITPGRKIMTSEDIRITYNEDFKFETDLPAKISYPKGGAIRANVATNLDVGFETTYQWQLGTPSGVKQKVTYKDIEGATSKTLVLKNADESYDGKYLRCYVSNYNGGAVSSSAKLSMSSGKVLSRLDFTFDIPNDGENYPDGAADIGRVTMVPEGVKVTDVKAVMFSKRLTGKASAGDNVGIGIAYEVLEGYDLADDFTVTINGEQATKVTTSNGVREASLGTRIIYNPDIDILTDLPGTIKFADGGSIEASVYAKGEGLKYQWQLGTAGGGVKQKLNFEDVEGATSSTLVIEKADDSYAGKRLRCVISAGNGNTVTKTAVLEMDGVAHVHTFTPGYDEEQHWERCSCGEVKLQDVHKLAVKSDADGHYSECECGYQTQKEAHKFGEWKVTKAATDKAAGSKERVCSVCKYKEVEAIPATALTTPFIDVPKDAYYYDATVWAYNAEPQITDGTSATTFGPDKICTRGQVVTFLWRAMGEPEPKSTKNPFVDVKSTDYFYYPVLWAVENGITDGTDATHFSPNNPCRNSHILTFIYRAMGEPNKTANPATWYADAYNWANFGGLLKGTYTGTFDVNAECPRKNVVQYLYKYYTMQ